MEFIVKGLVESTVFLKFVFTLLLIIGKKDGPLADTKKRVAGLYKWKS